MKLLNAFFFDRGHEHSGSLPNYLGTHCVNLVQSKLFTLLIFTILPINRVKCGGKLSPREIVKNSKKK